MRPGILIAALLLIVAAILFAPRAGRNPTGRRPSPSLPSAPGAPEAARAPSDAPEAPPPGKTDLESFHESIPVDDLLDTYPNEAWRNLEELFRYSDRWVTADKYEQAARWLRSAREHADRLRADRAYREEWQVRTRMRLHPILSDRPWVTASRPPWLVYVETSGGATRREQAYADRTAELLGRFEAEFYRQFGEPFELPRVGDCPYPSERVLLVAIFRTPQSFLEHLRRSGKRQPSYVTALYLPQEQLSVLHRESGHPLEDRGYGLFFPVAHQLRHVLTTARLQLDAPEKGELPLLRRNLFSRLAWFSTGLVRMLSANALRPDGTVRFFALDREGMLAWRTAREEKQMEWDLDTLLAVSDDRELTSKAAELAAESSHIGDAISLRILFRCQSAAFLHFLWHHRNPTYRKTVLEYLRGEFHGRTGPRHWKELWEGDGDGRELEAEFLAWVEKEFKTLKEK